MNLIYLASTSHKKDDNKKKPNESKVSKNSAEDTKRKKFDRRSRRMDKRIEKKKSLDNPVLNQLIFDAIHCLRTCGNGTELEALQWVLRPNQNELWYTYNLVKNDLERCIGRTYPDVRVELFGSTVMGMSFRGILQLNNLCY